MTAVNGAGGLGALLGLAVSVGVLLIVIRARAILRPSLAARSLVHLGLDPGPANDPWRVLVALLPRWRGRGRSTVSSLTWIGAGVGAGACLGAVATLRGENPLLLLLLPGLGGVLGMVAYRHHRRVRDTRMRRAVAAQLPSVAELLAFSVAAGESIVPALTRVGRMTGAELGAALRDCVADIRAGDTVEDALRGLAERTRSAEVESFVDRVTVSIERGTPLAEVLRAQAADARAQQRNALIEMAGRKDVAMLIPVVFLILPTVVLIALFPGIRALNMVAG